MKRTVLGVALALLALSTQPAQAQVAWDSPLLVGPGTPPGWGIYLVDPSPGDGIGVLSTWRAEEAPFGLGYRLGVAEGRADELAVYGGVDLGGYLVRRSEEIPVDVAWVTGAGFGIGDAFTLSFPLGASVGRPFEADGVLFHPYATPRVILDAHIGRDRPADDLQLELAVDVGIDIRVQPNWYVRFGATLGDRSAVAIGLSLEVL